MSSKPKPPDVFQAPLDALWQPPALIWTLLAGEGLAAVLSLGPGLDGDRWIRFGLMSLMVQWVSLIALATLWLFRRPLRRIKPLRVAYVALLLLMASAWLVGVAMWALLRDLLQIDEPWLPLMLRLSGVVLVVGLLGLAAFHNHWRARLLAVRTKQAELESLQARIRPHFLFNTLNSAVSLVRQRPADAEQLLLDLSDLFRAALSSPHDIPLADELDLARRYLEIEGIRFGPRLQTRWSLPDPIPKIRIPALSIQPIVENAVRHGIEQLVEGGLIDIEVAERGPDVVITVTNPRPLSPDGDTVGHSVGQTASRERISDISRGRGHLVATSTPDTYAVVITLPAAG